LLAEGWARAFPASDVALHSARGRAFLVPPVDHFLLGSRASRTLQEAGVTVDLVEQQLFVGYSLLVLAVLAVAAACVRWRSAPKSRPAVALALIGIAAALVSVGPGVGGCHPGSWAPACRFHDLLPMFRSYARFGIAAQLAVAILAGVAIADLCRSKLGSRLAVALIAIAVFEYWPFPWRAHDVLPTMGHRWLAEQSDGGRILDCIPPDAVTATTGWLMRRRVTVESGEIESCQDPNLASALASLGYTHLLVRAGREELPAAKQPGALAQAREFTDSRVYAVTAPVPAAAIVQWQGFHDYEHQGDDWWRWMGAEGQWTVRSAGDTDPVALDIELEAVAEPRRLQVALDGLSVGMVTVTTTNERYRLGPWRLSAGNHTLTFTALEPPLQPSAAGISNDDRALTVAFRRPEWKIDRPQRPGEPGGPQRP
jgi:hypothetical protein